MASYEFVVRINGTDAAFLPIFRNRFPRPKVCTSASLFVFKDRRRVHHLLVDCGPGVAEAIQAEGVFPGPFPIDDLVLSHAHPDHFLGIDALLGDQQWWARVRGLEAPRLRVLCHPDTYAETLGSYFPFRRLSVTHSPIQPGTTHEVWTDGTASLVLEQIEVVHFRHSVANLFTFDAGMGEGSLRVACLFDFGHFHPSDSPQARAGGTPDNPFFQGADLLIAESTTWNDQRKTMGRAGKHVAFEHLAEYLRTWVPQRARIVHYAGFEDAAGTGFEDYRRQVDEGLRIHPRIGPAADWELEAAIHAYLAEIGHPSPRSVSVARPLETLVVYPRPGSG